MLPARTAGQELSSKLLYDPAGTGQIFGSLVALHQLFNDRRFDPQLRSSAYCVPSQRPFCSPYSASERVEVELKEQLQELKEWKQTAAEADFPI